jgi:hypothetical protein
VPLNEWKRLSNWWSRSKYEIITKFTRSQVNDLLVYSVIFEGWLHHLNGHRSTCNFAWVLLRILSFEFRLSVVNVAHANVSGQERWTTDEKRPSAVEVEGTFWTKFEWRQLQSEKLSRPTKFIIYKTLIPVLLYGSETWVFTKREGNQLFVFEKKVLLTICGPKLENGVYRRR